MSGRQARFEIVRTDAGWHARFRAANGRIVWWTENYKRRRGAEKAIDAIRITEAIYAPLVAHRDTRDVDEREVSR